MQATLIENNGTGRIAYDSLILDNPKSFSALNSKLALKIVKSLAESPASAIDVSRKLKIHEQKVYYHMRRLEKAGIIYTISNEKRHGMIAKIYSVVSPVIAAKLYDKGVEVKENINLNTSQDILNFFHPFIEDGKLNSLFVVGDPYPHGKYDKGGLDACYGIELACFIGNLLKEVGTPMLKTDIKLTNDDLKNNLIIVGGPLGNVITQKLNSEMPLYFDENKEFAIASKLKKQIYNDDQAGVLIKMRNPFNENKYVLLVAGKRTRGTRIAVLGLTKFFNDIFKSIKSDETIAKVIHGYDKDGDGIEDNIKILE